MDEPVPHTISASMMMAMREPLTLENLPTVIRQAVETTVRKVVADLAPDKTVMFRQLCAENCGHTEDEFHVGAIIDLFDKAEFEAFAAQGLT